MEPETILRSKAIHIQIEKACRRHFNDETEATACQVYVLDSLAASDYRKLRAFKGKSSFNTYLHTLIHRLVIDYARTRYGRKRVPAPVISIGKWAVSVWMLVCFQKFSFDDAYEILRIKGEYNDSFNAYELDIEKVKEYPCPENPHFSNVHERLDNDIQTVQDEDANPLTCMLLKLDQQRRISAGIVIRQVIETFSDKDQLLVRLVYGSDMSAAAAGKAIGLKPPAARKRLRKLLLKFKEKLLSVGIREA